jgi:hypothetical protein
MLFDPASSDFGSKSLRSAARDGPAGVGLAALLQGGGVLRQSDLELQQRILRMQQNLQASKGDKSG